MEKNNKLNVFLNEKLVGYFNQRSEHSIFYYSDEAKQNISISLPKEEQALDNFQLKAAYFFDNLLPEGNARNFLLKFFQIKSKSSFDILKVIGREVAGALSFCLDNVLPQKNYIYREISKEIKKYFQTRQQNSLQEVLKARFSLAGMQDKLAVIYVDNKIYIPDDYSPTSHIIKPDIIG